MPIPFVKDIDFTYGAVEQVSPLLRRVIANNPSPFTYVGTGVYIVGQGEVAVIDPGPHDPDHFEALKRALAGETVKYVLVTHGHSDHSPLARPLAAWAGCKVYAKDEAEPTAKGVLGSEDDPGFRPDVRVRDGDRFSGPGWTLEVIETPGHTRTHICFDLKEENACLTGDHIMGWSTTIVAPPDGNMADYFDSLDRIETRGFETLWPTHGSPVRGRPLSGPSFRPTASTGRPVKMAFWASCRAVSTISRPWSARSMSAWKTGCSRPPACPSLAT